MQCMFNECHKLKELNIYSFKTKNVINMSGMFQECNNLEKLIIT